MGNADSKSKAGRGQDVQGIRAISPHLQQQTLKSRCDSPNYNLKVVVRGTRGVGKTSLVRRLQGQPLEETYTPTKEISTATINWNYKTSDDNVKVEVWDVVDRALTEHDAMRLKGFDDDLPAGVVEMAKRASRQKHGSERIGALDAEVVDVYRGADAVIVVYDVSNKESFEAAKRYFMTIPKELPVLLLGNKRDVDPSDIAVPLADARAIAEQESRKHARKLGGYRVAAFEASFKDCFGLKVLYSYFNVPFLEMKVATMEHQLQRLRDELTTTREEVQVYMDNLDYEQHKAIQAKLAEGRTPVKQEEEQSFSDRLAEYEVKRPHSVVSPSTFQTSIDGPQVPTFDGLTPVQEPTLSATSSTTNNVTHAEKDSAHKMDKRTTKKSSKQSKKKKNSKKSHKDALEAFLDVSDESDNGTQQTPQNDDDSDDVAGLPGQSVNLHTAKPKKVDRAKRAKKKSKKKSAKSSIPEESRHKSKSSHTAESCNVQNDVNDDDAEPVDAQATKNVLDDFLGSDDDEDESFVVQQKARAHIAQATKPKSKARGGLVSAFYSDSDGSSSDEDGELPSSATAQEQVLELVSDDEETDNVGFSKSATSNTSKSAVVSSNSSETPEKPTHSDTCSQVSATHMSATSDTVAVDHSIETQQAKVMSVARTVSFSECEATKVSTTENTVRSTRFVSTDSISSIPPPLPTSEEASTEHTTSVDVTEEELEHDVNTAAVNAAAIDALFDVGNTSRESFTQCPADSEEHIPGNSAPQMSKHTTLEMVYDRKAPSVAGKDTSVDDFVPESTTKQSFSLPAREETKPKKSDESRSNFVPISSTKQAASSFDDDDHAGNDDEEDDLANFMPTSTSQHATNSSDDDEDDDLANFIPTSTSQHPLHAPNNTTDDDEDDDSANFMPPSTSQQPLHATNNTTDDDEDDDLANFMPPSTSQHVKNNTTDDDEEDELTNFVPNNTNNRLSPAISEEDDFNFVPPVTKSSGDVTDALQGFLDSDSEGESVPIGTHTLHDESDDENETISTLKTTNRTSSSQPVAASLSATATSAIQAALEAAEKEARKSKKSSKSNKTGKKKKKSKSKSQTGE